MRNKAFVGKIFTVLLLTLFFAVTAMSVVHAQTLPTPAAMPTWLIKAPPGPGSGLELVNIVRSLTNWLFAIFLVLAVIFVILAAFQFLTANGDTNQLAQARKRLLWSAIAVVAAAMSQGVAFMVQSVLGL